MNIVFIAHFRNKYGTRSSKVLRNKKQYPCILYPVNGMSVPIYLKENEIFKLKDIKNIYSEHITIILNTNKYLSQIKEVQRHAFKSNILHIDFFIKKQL
ncbi:50S ribosomal protein L25 [Buchnera aphidicola (Chaitoregma tattakana)]|uniref:50S ribosomal protein L25 n=1 Tax=Buchnera aphidicola TaxID=9 RepID=UPI0031B7FE80